MGDRHITGGRSPKFPCGARWQMASRVRRNRWHRSNLRYSQFRSESDSIPQERPLYPTEGRGTDGWPAEKPCPKQKAARSGQECRHRGRTVSSGMSAGILRLSECLLKDLRTRCLSQDRYCDTLLGPCCSFLRVLCTFCVPCFLEPLHFALVFCSRVPTVMPLL